MVCRVCITLSHHLYQQCILLVANLVMSTRVRFEFTVFCFHHFDFWTHGFKCRSTYIQRRIKFLLLQMSYLSQRTIVIYVPVLLTPFGLQLERLPQINCSKHKALTSKIRLKFKSVRPYHLQVSRCVYALQNTRNDTKTTQERSEKPVKVQSMIDLLRSYSRSTKRFSIS